jgi:hypothetical protein
MMMPSQVEVDLTLDTGVFGHLEVLKYDHENKKHGIAKQSTGQFVLER